MIKKIDRYIFFESFKYFFITLFTITFVMLLEQIFRMFDLILGKGLSIAIVLKLFLLAVPFIIATSVPMSVLVGVLITFGNLSATNEITAFKASGINLYRLSLSIIIGVVVLVISLTYFNCYILPKTNYQIKNLSITLGRIKPSVLLKEKVFNTEFSGYSILVQRINEKTNVIEDVTIVDYKDSILPRFITAENGKLYYQLASQTLTIELHNGEIHDVDRKNKETYHILDFETYNINLSILKGNIELENRQKGDREMTFDELVHRISNMENGEIKNEKVVFKGIPQIKQEVKNKKEELKNIDIENKRDELKKRRLKNEIFTLENSVKDKERKISQYKVEIHKKFALPIACFVFVLIGIPLGVVTKRGGSAGVGISIFFFVIYYLFLIAGETLADRGYLSPFLSMWMANIILGTFGLYLFYHTVQEADWIVWEKLVVITEKIKRYFSKD